MANDSSQIYMIRQPIFTSNLDVYAYELLFDSNHQLTASAIINLLTESQKLVDEKYACISITTNLLQNLPPLPSDKFILQINYDDNFSERVVENIKNLAEQGYTFILDNYQHSSKTEWLLTLVKFVKISFTNEINKQNFTVKPKLMVKNIETNEQFSQCKEIGFDYFQGNFLSKPANVASKRTETNKLVVMRLLAKLNDPKLTIDEIEVLLSEDPKLSYKILKIINSAAYVKTKTIESLHQAIVFMGLNRLKEWGSIIAMSSVHGKPHELMLTTMIRAKMCEKIALMARKTDVGKYFTAGILSTLNVLLDDAMENLLPELPISDEIKQALLDESGEIGDILSQVKAYERAEWKVVDTSYITAYMESVEWANNSNRAIRN